MEYNSLDNYIGSLNPMCWLNSQHVNGYNESQPNVGDLIGLPSNRVWTDISGNSRHGITDGGFLQPSFQVDSNNLPYLKFEESLLSVVKPIDGEFTDRIIILVGRDFEESYGIGSFQQAFYGIGNTVKQIFLGGYVQSIIATGYYNNDDSYYFIVNDGKINVSNRNSIFCAIIHIKKNQFVQGYNANYKLNKQLTPIIDIGNYSRYASGINLGGRGVGVNAIEGDDSTFQLVSQSYRRTNIYEYIDIYSNGFDDEKINRVQSYVKTKYNI